MGNSLPIQKKLISISEAAKVLGVSIDTVRRWDKLGVLHSERPDGKNRYFSPDELKKHKLCQSLSISEAAISLGISTTTLRRLETRGLIKPKRNNAGERVYDKGLLKSFLNSDYLLRKKQIKEKILEPFQKKVKNDSGVNLKPLQRIPELLAATAMFFLLLAIGITNISVQVVKSPLTFSFPTKSQAPTVLSQTIESQLNPTPVATAEAILNPPVATDGASPSDTTETEPMKIVTVILEDKSSIANIRKEATTSSSIIGQARNGSSYELISKTADWYEVKLVEGSIGFISAKYIWKDEEDN